MSSVKHIPHCLMWDVILKVAGLLWRQLSRIVHRGSPMTALAIVMQQLSCGIAHRLHQMPVHMLLM